MSDRYDQLREFYEEFSTSDDHARRVAWRARDDQELRFEVLLEVLEDLDYPASVLDVGCGVGSLYSYLERTGRLADYVGIDLLPKMIATARTRHPDVQFIQGDLLTQRNLDRFDLVVCSGALNVVVKHHELWVQRMLKAMWKLARKAVAVNFQTTRAFKFSPLAALDDDIYHVEPGLLLTWAQSISPWASMRMDYLGNDATIYLYRDYHRTVTRIRRQERDTDGRTPVERVCGDAFLLLERKMPRAALKVLESAKDTASVLNLRGLCHHHLNEHRKARYFYQKAVALDPNLEAARLNLRSILIETGTTETGTKSKGK